MGSPRVSGGDDSLGGKEGSEEGWIPEERLAESEEGANVWTKAYQVESGEVQEQRVTEEVFLFIETFPLWLLALNKVMHPGGRVVAYICDEAFWLRRSMDLTLHYQVTHRWEDAMSWWSNRDSDKPRQVLLQGSSTFAKDVWVLVGPTRTVKDKVIFVCSGKVRSNLRRDLQWFTRSHANFGGVTSGVFNIGLSNHFELERWKTHVFSHCRRALIDIVKADKGGVECENPAGQNDKSQMPNTAKPIASSKLTMVLPLPSVFNRKTGWVMRKLSLEEIALAMDLPVKTLPLFAVNASLSPKLVKSLIMLPPLKVIQGCLNIMLEAKSNVRSPQQNERSEGINTISLSVYRPSVAASIIKEEDLKSVKRDDAITQSSLWDTAALHTLDQKTLTYVQSHDEKGKAVNTIFRFLRQCMLLRFKRNVLRSGLEFLRQEYGDDWQGRVKQSNRSSPLMRDVEGVKFALWYTSEATFWEWKQGSYPLFWRWQPEVKLDMRDGTSLWIKGPLPHFFKPQRPPRDTKTAELVTEKLWIPIIKRYIMQGLIKSLTSYFSVPKGLDDIRMVYNLTACGLNEALWSPTFWMPNVGHVVDCATETSWFGDVDAAEMFLNYLLDIKLRAYAGVDLSWLSDEKNPLGVKWGRWNRMPMGLRPSPWVTIRLFAWAMEIIRGDRKDQKNPFHWSTVVMNCPGTESYDPSMPRLFKWSDEYKAIAGDAKTFVDDLRSIGCSEEHCRAITHRVESMMGYLGLQDATRKRRPVSQSPGEWTGSIVRAIPEEGLFVTVSIKKWDKIKNSLQELKEVFSSPSDRPLLKLKQLEERVGFLVHVAMTYPMMFPFLKGFYLTMNSWREGRDEDDWRLPPAAFKVFLKESRGRHPEDFELIDDEGKTGPELVRASTSLFEHLDSLSSLFEGKEPTLRLIRGKAIFEVLYAFGDASGSGFGSSWTEAKQTKVSWRFGVWGVEEEGSSSNYRELRNLTETLEDMGGKKQLTGREVFIFTDNMVSESVIAKGSSQNPTLYALVVRIIRLQMKHKCIIRIVHVAGTRMIDQGTDGLSRGSLHEGIMTGRSMLDFVPLHLPAWKHADKLKSWVNSWAGVMGNAVEWLEPEGWFERGHDICGSASNSDGVWIPTYKKGTFIWCPPPAVASPVMDELRQARHKRQDSFHVFMCPRLLYPEWRRGLYKSADLMFEIKAGTCSFWPAEAHETLVIALYFPYLNRFPWELRKAPLLVAMGRKMSKVFKTDEATGSIVLSEFCQSTRRMDRMPVLNLRKMLSGQSRSLFSD